MFTDAKQRFSNRVSDYLRYRPGYPAAVLDLLRTECHLLPGHAIADIGSGTGLLSELFLKNGNRVFGVEPNDAMRLAGEEYLKDYPEFVSVNAAAEATTLPDASVDFVAAGQAFHWFDPPAARREFARTLKPGGWLVILWQERRTDTPFAKDYEAMLVRYGTDYKRVREAYPDTQRVQDFFENAHVDEKTLPNSQVFNLHGLAGRLHSSSYAPAKGHANFSPIMAELERIFHLHQRAGHVHMEYVTRIYFGHLRSGAPARSIAPARPSGAVRSIAKKKTRKRA